MECLEDHAIDLIVWDYALDHVEDVADFRDEVSRVLKPGGIFCRRTPHALNYVSVVARLVRNARQQRWLRSLEPQRKAEDVFPTVYRCNTLGRLRRVFRGWEGHSYVYSSEPQYYGGSWLVFRLFSLFHRIAPSAFTGSVFMFLRKS